MLSLGKIISRLWLKSNCIKDNKVPGFNLANLE